MKISDSPRFDARTTDLGPLISKWCAIHPVITIVLVSLVAVAVNCYPVIFCGKSYVSPTLGVVLVYEKYPTLPVMKENQPTVAHGSDTGAAMIWGVPMGFLESRSVWEHGEIPLWNRDSHAGDTLIGQAISMIGDPLHWIVIAGHGAAGAWDIKFVLAKFLFCVGFGLLILRLLGSRPMSLIFAALAAYCGAFYYIYNHPAFFVFCYAPWILLSAIELFDLQSKRYFVWGLVWLLVNFGCFNGGHIEPAVVLIGGLNFAAAAFALAGARGVRAALTIIGRGALATGLFLALTAPMWISFLVALQGAFSIHSEIKVVQFPFASLLGIFDDVFFRLPAHSGPFMAPAPASSFLIMTGGIYALVRWRILKQELFFWINLGAIFLWGGCIFGWVPSPLLSLIPMLNRVGHTHTDFSYLLIIHLTILCAYGFKCLANEETFRRAAAGLAWVAAIIAAMTVLYFFGFEHGAVPWLYYAIMLVGALAAPLLFAFLKSRKPLSSLGILCIAILAFIPHFRFGLYDFGNENILIVPKGRVVLNAPSPAINKIKEDVSAPFRVVGGEYILWGDYAATYDLEDIRSCAPLSNGELINLLHDFPGMVPISEWEINLISPVTAHGLLNLLNVKYLLTRPEITAQEGSGFRVDYRNDLAVIENLEVWPRAFFSGQIESIASNKEFIQHLQQNEQQPFIALTPEEIAKEPEISPLLRNTNSMITAATNYQLLPNSTAFDIRADTAGMVCLTEGQAKDFMATANGQPKTVLTANRAFKAIYLDKPGNYHIQFTYRPGHWRLSCGLFWAAIGTIAILSAVFLLSARFKKIEPSSNSGIPPS